MNATKLITSILIGGALLTALSPAFAAKTQRRSFSKTIYVGGSITHFYVPVSMLRVGDHLYSPAENALRVVAINHGADETNISAVRGRSKKIIELLRANDGTVNIVKNGKVREHNLVHARGFYLAGQ